MALIVISRKEVFLNNMFLDPVLRFVFNKIKLKRFFSNVIFMDLKNLKIAISYLQFSQKYKVYFNDRPRGWSKSSAVCFPGL